MKLETPIDYVYDRMLRLLQREFPDQVKSQKDMGAWLGLGESTIPSSKTAQKVTDSHVWHVAAETGARAEWIWTGKGRMYRSEKDALVTRLEAERDAALAERDAVLAKCRAARPRPARGYLTAASPSADDVDIVLPDDPLEFP